MARLYADSSLRPLLRKELGEETYWKVCHVLNQAPTIESIPYGYIECYAKSHDAVCQVNLQNLLERYKADLEVAHDKNL